MLIDFRTTGPKRRCNRRFGPVIITTPPQHNTTNTSSSRNSRNSWDTKPPAQMKISRRVWGIETGVSWSLNGMCFFFLFSLTMLIFIYTYSYNYGTSTSTSTAPAPTACEKGPKRRVSRRLGLRWVFLNLLCVFFWYLTIYIATMDSLKVRCGSTQAKTMTTGPNDARHVVWA